MPAYVTRAVVAAAARIKFSAPSLTVTSPSPHDEMS